jgi:hypothetical protein
LYFLGERFTLVNVDNIGASGYMILITIFRVQKVLAARQKVRSMKMRKLKFLSHYR